MHQSRLPTGQKLYNYELLFLEKSQCCSRLLVVFFCGKKVGDHIAVTSYPLPCGMNKVDFQGRLMISEGLLFSPNHSHLIQPSLLPSQCWVKPLVHELAYFVDTYAVR